MYFGSARGPGGLQARLGRHLRGEGKPHWHIDILRSVADVRGYCYVTDQKSNSLSIPFECLWSQAFATIPGATVPLEGFGASDCRAGCPAHLITCSGSLTLQIDVVRSTLAQAIDVSDKKLNFSEKFSF